VKPDPGAEAVVVGPTGVWVAEPDSPLEPLEPEPEPDPEPDPPEPDPPDPDPPELPVDDVPLLEPVGPADPPETPVERGILLEVVVRKAVGLVVGQ